MRMSRMFTATKHSGNTTSAGAAPCQPQAIHKALLAGKTQDPTSGAGDASSPRATMR